ncbi:MAG: hypothetical protein AB1778_09850 [Candidatus Bipolaricaulota bacterium]
MNPIQRAVVVLIGDGLATAQARIEYLALGSWGREHADHLDSLCHILCVDPRRAESSDEMAGMLRDAFLAINPAPTAMDPVRRQTVVEENSVGYVVFEAWTEGVATAVVSVVTEMRRACRMRSIQLRVNCIAVLPGTLGNECTDEHWSSARRTLSELEDLLLEASHSELEVPAVQAVWLADGINARGQDLMGGATPAALAGEVVAALLMYAGRVPRPGGEHSGPSSRAFYRSLGVVRAVVPRDAMLAAIARQFSVNFLRDRVATGRVTTTAGAIVVAKELLACVSPNLLEERLRRDDSGSLLITPFTSKKREDRTGRQAIEALKEHAKIYRQAIFDPGYHKLQARAAQIRKESEATLRTAVREKIDSPEGGVRWVLAAVATCLDRFWRSKWIDSQKAALPPDAIASYDYTLRLLRKTYTKHLSKEINIPESELFELLETPGSADEGGAVGDEEDRAGPSEGEARLQTEPGIAAAQERLASGLDRQLMDLGRTADEHDSHCIAVSEELERVEANRAWHAVAAFLVVPGAILAAMLGLAILLALAGAARWSTLSSPAVLPYLGVGLCVTYAATGSWFLYSTVWKKTSLKRELDKTREALHKVEDEAERSVEQYFEVLWRLRVADEVNVTLQNAETALEGVQCTLADFVGESVSQAERLEADVSFSPADVATVELIPRQVYKEVFANYPSGELSAASDSLTQPPRATMSARALGGRSAVAPLVADAMAAAAEDLRMPLDLLDLSSLFLLKDHAGLRNRFVISPEAVLEVLRQVEPFVQLRRVPVAKPPDVVRSLWVSSDARASLDPVSTKQGDFSEICTQADRYSAQATAITTFFSLEHVNMLSTPATGPAHGAQGSDLAS